MKREEILQLNREELIKTMYRLKLATCKAMTSNNMKIALLKFYGYII